MNQHSSLKPRASLLERAAEVYDFAAQIRPPALPRQASAPAARQPLEAPAEPPARPQKQQIILSAPDEADELVLDQPVPAEAAPVRKFRPAPPPRRGTISRENLEEGGFIVPDGPVTGLTEEFRIIKRQLLLGTSGGTGIADDKRRMILVCSSQPDEGKTFCAINLALSLAGEKDTEVLLVDADVAKPEILSILGLEAGPGLTDAIIDAECDVNGFVIETDIEGLSVLPAGRQANDVTELLASGRTRELLADLTARHPNRVLIFDSPPALMASPAAVLATHAGQVLMVVRADHTPEADLREAIGLLSGCDTLSLMLNGTGLTASSRRFGSYYGYGQ